MQSCFDLAVKLASGLFHPSIDSAKQSQHTHTSKEKREEVAIFQEDSSGFFAS
jgi:hypothetical protein